MTLPRASLAILLATLAGCGGKVVVDPTPSPADAPPKVILANSGDTLYAVRPPTEDDHLAHVEVIATFKGCEDVNELAMSSTGTLYAATATGLYTVDRSDGTCTLVAMGAYPESLAFVPPGTVDPDEEALVGYMGASYVRVDPSTGTVTTIGSFGSSLVPRGDLAADLLGNAFLTVEGEGCDVCLVRVDAKTGALAEMLYPTGEDISGLAYADGALYGVGTPVAVWEFTTVPPVPLEPFATGFPLTAPSELHDLRGATAER
ncbi:MAG: hypothetical protein QM820_11900 [Minicystis sp.]